ncbi:MAG: hypothetical protein WAT79_14925 [Saprospiraceae bacterium]
MKYKIKELCYKHDLNSSKGCLHNYCSKCSEKVTDLTNVEDKLLPILAKSKVNTCVSIRPNQLHFLNNYINFAIAKSALLATSVSIMATSCHKYLIQDFGTNYGKISLNKAKDIEKTPTENKIKGRIICSYSNEPIMFGTVHLLNSNHVTQTDLEGYFELDVPKNLSKNQMVRFKLIGYYPVEVDLLKIINKDIIVQLGSGPWIGYLELIE